MASETENAIKQMANREVFNNTFRNLADGSIFDYIDYANTGSVDYKVTSVYARGGQGGGRRMRFDGEPEATMKFSTQIITPKLISMVAGAEVVKGKNFFRHKTITSVTDDTATKITFPVGEIPVADTLSIYPQGVELNDTNKVAGTFETGTFTFAEKADNDGEYECFYQTSVAESQTVTFKSNVFPKSFIWDGETLWKDDDGNVKTEIFHAYNCSPQQNFTMNYSNSGDPSSLEITFDLLSDKNHNIFDKTFLPEE
jgi:hypothetical protein